MMLKIDVYGIYFCFRFSFLLSFEINLIMEIKVYRNFKDCQNNKMVFCAKIECPDTFLFEKAVSVFKSIFPDCVVVVMAV